MAKSAVATSYPNENSFGGKLKGLWDRTLGFLSDVRTEMKHVSYPNAKEVQGTTVVVIITVAIFGVFFFVADYFFGHLMDWVIHTLSR